MYLCKTLDKRQFDPIDVHVRYYVKFSIKSYENNAWKKSES